MNLEELFRDLALGELNNLSVVDNFTIKGDKRPQVTVYANDGLLDLHSRFVLKEKDMIVEMREGITNYHLLKRYAVSQYDEDNPPDRWAMPYIMDTVAEPFQEDVIKILSVWNTFGMPVPLNDLERTDSVFNPQSNVLQVPFPIPLQALGIEYQAKHAPLDHCNCKDLIELPDILIPALKAFISSKVFSHMNSQDGTVKGQQYMMEYESLCQGVIDKDLVNSSSSVTNSRFEKRGWK